MTIETLDFTRNLINWLKINKQFLVLLQYSKSCLDVWVMTGINSLFVTYIDR